MDLRLGRLIVNQFPSGQCGSTPQGRTMSKVKIGGHTFKVEVSDLEDGDCGEINYTNGVISISSNINSSLQQSTLLHEAIHGMNATMNHEFLDSLAEQIFQFLKDNKLWNEEQAKKLLGSVG